MTWYLEIEPLQEPFDIGPDENGRARLAFNARARKDYSVSFDEEVALRLQAAGVGVLGATLFVSTASKVPDGDGPFVSVIRVPGVAPERSQNTWTQPIRQRPQVQVVARARSYVAARGAAEAAYAALASVRNRELPAS